MALWVLLILLTSGCASVWNAKPIPGVPQPETRIKQIRELGASAQKVSPEEQQEFAQTLSTIVHDEEDSIMRREAVMAISHYQVPITEETLRFAEKDPERDVREAACLGWKNYGGPNAVPEIIQILSTDTDLDIRLQAIELLGEMKDERAVAALEVPLADSDAALQHFTILALQKITGLSTTDRQEWLAYCRERRPQTEVAQETASPAPQSPFLDFSQESLQPKQTSDSKIPEFKEK